MQLRNFILLGLAFDATAEEIDAAHDALDRINSNSINSNGAVRPEVLISANVDTQTGETNTTGTGTPIQPPQTTVQLDGAGLPWDERIHSSNKQMTDKNVWRARRNVDPALKAKVEGELRATLAAGGGVAAAPQTDAASAQPPAGGLPALPGSNVPNLPLPGAAAIDPAYAALVQFIAQNTHSASNAGGRINDDWVKQVLTHFGVADGSLQNLAHAPQLVPQIDQYIRQALA